MKSFWENFWIGVAYATISVGLFVVSVLLAIDVLVKVLK